MKLPNLKSGGKLLLGIGGLLVIIFFTMGYYFINQQILIKCEHRHVKAVEAKSWILEARRHEKNFLLRGDSQYVSKVRDAVKEIKDIMAVLNTDSAKVDEYLSKFDGLVKQKASFDEFESQLVPIARAAGDQLGQIEITVQEQIVKLERNTIVISAILLILVICGSIAVFIFSIKLITALNKTTDEMHSRNMSLAMNLTDYFNVINALSQGNLDISASEHTNDELMDKLGEYTNKMIVSYRELAEVCNRVAEGDLSVKVVPRSDKDVLGLAFAKMITDIGQITEELHGSTMGLALNLTDYFNVIKALSEGDLTTVASEDSKDELINQLGKSTNNMISSLKRIITQVSQAVVTITDSSEQLSSSTQEMNASAQAISERMNQLVTIAAQESKIVEGLGEKSQRIGEITEAIASIADQTNLLALNAAIEAARAGEAGRGFAVVAEEVRKLAEASGSALKNIGDLIKSIQQETNRAVTSITKESSPLVDEVASSVEEQISSIEQVASSSQALASMGADLKEAIAKFKLSKK